MSPAADQTPVLDASALLTDLRDEAGAGLVADVIAGGPAMSTVNLAEALSRAAGRSLGDRACLALARRLGARAVTSDTAWTGIELAVGVELTLIR